MNLKIINNALNLRREKLFTSFNALVQLKGALDISIKHNN